MSLPNLHTDTICALATPPGVGGLAVIRVSGPRAIEFCDQYFVGKTSLSEAETHTIHYGWWVVEESRVDAITATVFHSPHSYTGEYVVEIGCHGGVFVVEQIIGSLLRAHARLADPGEFTRRAFMNRKLDLTQAEAVADLIHSQSRVGSQIAARQLAGGFTRRLAALRQQLLDVIGLLELELDFSDEDVEFVNRSAFRDSIAQILREIEATTASAHGAEVLRSGFHVAVVGYPNAGKSSLFNALLQRNRAIVSDIPGTTRDYLSETLFIEGYAVHVSDTAGLRETSDQIELQGINITSSLIEQSDLVLVVNDASSGFTNSDPLVADLRVRFPEIEIVVAQNKIDLVTSETDSSQSMDSIRCSAITETGLQHIREAFFDRVRKSTSSVSDVLLNSRQMQLLKLAGNDVRSCQIGLEQGLSADFLAVDIRSAIRLFGDITGDSWNPDVLDSVFSRFCIGK